MAKQIDLFVDPGEVAGKQLSAKHGTVLFDGMVDKEYCVLSNKRLYFKGTSFMLGQMGGKAKTEAVVDLNSITATSFSISRHIFFLVLGILSILGGVAVLYMVREETLAYALFGLAILMVILYFGTIRRLLTVIYKGGSLNFLCWGKSEKAMRSFCAEIHKAAENAKSNEVEIIEPVPVIPVTE